MSDDQLCVCGCADSAHFERWENGHLQGIACDVHGGHALVRGTQPALITEPLAPVRTPCPACPSGFLTLGVCVVCGYGTRAARQRFGGHRGGRRKGNRRP